MLRILRPFFLFAVLLVIAGFATKHWFELKLKTQLDHQFAKWAHLVDVTYAKAYLDVDGSVVVENFSVAPRRQDLGVSFIEEIRLTPSSRLYYPEFLLAEQPELPRGLTAQFKQASIGVLESPFLSAWLESVNDRARQAYQPICGDTQFLGPKDWQAMGYRDMVSDITLAYSRVPEQQNFHLELELSKKDWAQFTLRSTLFGVGHSLPNLKDGQLPTLQTLEMVYEDLGYGQRELKYCSERMQVTPDLYATFASNREPEYFQQAYGIIPGVKMRAAYKDFLLKPQNFSLSGYPADDFKMSQLVSVPPSEWPKLLRMNLQINDKTVPLDIVNPAKAAQTAESVNRSYVDNTDTSDKEITSPPPQVTQYYRDVAKKDIDTKVGQRIRVTSVNGRVREGLFLGVDKGDLKIQTDKYSSKVTLRVSLYNTERIEVLE